MQIEANREVAGVGLISHKTEIGAGLGLRTLLLEHVRFDVASYRERYADLYAIGDDQLALHYLSQGLFEGRIPTHENDATVPRTFRHDEVCASLSIGGVKLARFLSECMAFDADSYRKRYPDLRSLNNEQAVQHYVLHGMLEARLPTYRGGIAGVQAMLARTSLTSAERRSVECEVALAAFAQTDPFELDPGALNELMIRAFSYLPAIVIGDSHANFLIQCDAMLAGGLLPVPVICSGGSAGGLINPNSKAGYGKKISAFLAGLGWAPAGLPIIFKFGQVDVEFVFNFKRIASGQQTLDRNHLVTFLRETVRNYINFLLHCATLTPARIIATGIFPPTLRDEALRQGYINAHIGFLHSDEEIASLSEGMKRLELPDQRTRTAIHREFNVLLEAACDQAGITFVEDFDSYLTSDGLVAAAFISDHDGTDHHFTFTAEATRQRVTALANKISKMMRFNCDGIRLT